MIKVECPSCASPYDLDERRLPASGLKMRCPKCGSSFQVQPDGSVGAAGAPPRPGGTALGIGSPGAPPRPPPPPPPGGARKPTMLGLGAPGDSDVPELDSDDLESIAPGAGEIDLPAPKPAGGGFKLKSPAELRMPSPGDSGTADFDLDLPAPKAPGMRIKTKSARADDAHVPGLDVDLPAPKGSVGARTQAHGGIDLPAPKASGGGMGGIDLPAPKRASGGLGGIDLPAPKPSGGALLGGGVDLPAPKSPAAPQAGLPAPKVTAQAGGFDLDLPAPKAPSSRGGLDLDLPAPKAPSSRGGLDLDLPAPKVTAPSGGGFDLDLPAPKAAASGRGGIDLPAPKGGGGGFDLDLPAPKAASSAGGFDLDLPAPKSVPGGLDLDLPTPKAAASARGGIDLPAPKGGGGFDLDLPTPKASSARTPFDDMMSDVPGGGVDLPAPAGAGGLDLDLPVPKVGQREPSTLSGSGIDDLDLPMPKSSVAGPAGLDDLDLPMPAGSPPLDDMPQGIPDLELPSPRSDLLDAELDDDDLALPEPKMRDVAPSARPPASAGLTPDGRGGAGGVGFGELDLGGGDDELEFADLPQDAPGSTPPPGPSSLADRKPREARSRLRRLEREEEPKRGRGVWVVAALLLLGVAAGVGVGLFTEHGFFGYYALEQLLPAAGDDAEIERLITSAEEGARADTYRRTREALNILGFARSESGLNRRLLARSLLHESMYQVRFGEDGDSAQRAASILARLNERSADAPGIHVARAADSLRRGNLAAVSGLLSRARAEDASDAYVELVAGELALRQQDYPAAVAAFDAAAAKGGGAQALWGKARALLAGEDRAAAMEVVAATLEASPLHVEARLEKARELFANGEAAEAIRLTREAVGATPVGEGDDAERLRASVSSRAGGLTLLATMYEADGRRGQAREMYEAALLADPFRAEALLGAGRSLLAERRWRDALARFEAIMEAGDELSGELPAGSATPQVQAQLGAVRAMLQLERTQDAKALMARLVAAEPENPEALLWLGKAEQALNEFEPAEGHFRDVMRLAPTQFDGYLALAQLFFATERGEEAGAVLEQARARVEQNAEVARMLGEAELSRGRVTQAIAEFRRAIAMDANDTAALFALGGALRRDRQLDEATRVLDRLAELDDAYPGLALERGRIYEAQGESGRAVESYRLALEEEPEDANLKLRLGAALISAGDVDGAEQILRQVLQEQSTSAEAEHYMGRVEFARGNNQVALRHFDRAATIDPTRAEFHLYLAWAALEVHNLGRALESISASIDRDPSLGDAYFIRGRVRLRLGQIRDALADLERALELKPDRYEALAFIAECYDQMDRSRDAIQVYERALAIDEDQPEWWYRLGRLRLLSGDRGRAVPALDRSIEIAGAQDPPPPWLAEAYRLQGDAKRQSNDTAAAIAAYERYLELAPSGAIDRREVEQHLRNLR